MGLATNAESKHGRNRDDRRYSLEPIPQGLSNLGFEIARVGNAVRSMALHHDIAQDSVDTIMHLGGKTIHDAVDDDERRDTQGDRYDRSKGDPASAEISPAEQELVHATILG